MTGERRIDWAPSGETPKYRTEDDDPAGGNFVVAEDVSGSTVLLQWNDSNSRWEFAGNVDLGSNDLTNVGSISTDGATINNAPTGSNDALRWQEGVETGEITADGLNNSTGDNDWGQSERNTVSDSFANAFAATPKIAIAEDQNTAGLFPNEWKAGLENASSTGLDAVFHQMAANDRSGTTDAYAIEYVASEGR